MQPGRPLTFDPQVALESAMQQFWQRGYAGCSLQQLLGATGLSRSSLYQAFGGKSALFLRCVDLYRDRIAAQLNGALRDANSARTFIESTLRSVVEEPRGCLLVNIAAEFGQSDRQVAAILAASFQRFEKIFQRAVEQGQRAGEFDPALDAEQVGRFLVATTSGLRTLVKSGASAQAIDETVELALRALR